MNPRQRSYDSYDKTNKLLKLTNSYYHFRNLEHIKKRKPQFGNNPTLYPKKNPHVEPFQDYFIKKQNENIQEKLNKIKNRKAKVNLNDIFQVAIDSYTKKSLLDPNSIYFLANGRQINPNETISKLIERIINKLKGFRNLSLVFNGKLLQTNSTISES